MRDALPAGTVTFLFTDVEGSTLLLKELGAAAYAAALTEHRRIVREALQANGGVEVDTQGDSFFVAFPTAPGALAAAEQALEGLAPGPIRVRIGIHTGTPHLGREGYVGVDVHRAARIAACGHGGQVLVSSSAASLVDADRLTDLGEHRLKDLPVPERIFQLGDVRFPPIVSLLQTRPPAAPKSATGTPAVAHGEVHVRGPDDATATFVPLTGSRAVVGRLPDVNDIPLQPDPDRLVTRAAHCTFERERAGWFIVDGGSVNGTFLRRGSAFERITERRALRTGDVVCVLARVDGAERRFFELEFYARGDSQATRGAPSSRTRTLAIDVCLRYDTHESRLVVVRHGELREIRVRAKLHALVRHMAERNAAAGGAPAFCTHEELIEAVWGAGSGHTRGELARLVWELRRQLDPYAAQHLVENERRGGYRLVTCTDGAAG